MKTNAHISSVFDFLLLILFIGPDHVMCSRYKLDYQVFYSSKFYLLSNHIDKMTNLVKNSHEIAYHISLNPSQNSCYSSINTRVVSQSTSSSPAYNTSNYSFSIFITNKRTTRITFSNKKKLDYLIRIIMIKDDYLGRNLYPQQHIQRKA